MSEVREGYKMTELGEIPSDWDVLNLGQIAKRITTKNKGLVSENVLTISAQHGLVSQTEFFNKKVASSNLEGYYLLEKNDFSYNKSYSNGYPMGAIKSLTRYEKGVVSTLYICFRLNENLNTSYFTNYFDSDLWHKQVAEIAQEGARNHGLLNVAVNEFFNIKMIVPSTDEQQKIASILSTVDEQIDETEQLIVKTKELKKGLMQQLLTKGIGHTEFKQTELGEIPIEWEVKLIREVADVVSGGTPSKSVKSYWENGEILWATPTDITKNKSKYIDRTELSITQLGLEKSSATLLPPGTILMTSRATIGERSIAKTFITTNQGFKSFICKAELNNEYMYYALEFLKPYFLANASGSTFLEISKAATENQLMFIPLLKEQQKIASILSTVDEQIEAYEEEKAKYEELKKGLMQKLLTGQIRVKC